MIRLPFSTAIRSNWVFRLGVSRGLAPYPGPGDEQLPAPAGVFHVANLGLPLDIHLGNEPVWPGQKPPGHHICIFHGILPSFPGILYQLPARRSTKNAGFGKFVLDIRWPVCIIIYVVRRAPGGEIKIGDLCNGSTPDSDSVCGGSNPSSPAIAGAKLALLRCFFCTQGMKIAPLPLHPRGKFLRTPRAKPPCNRRRVTTFSMSLRPTALHPQTRLCLLHVIANQCAHWCGNPRPRRET